MRDDVDIAQIIRIYPEGDYDYNSLLDRQVLTATMALVESKPDYKWDWQMLTSQSGFIPSAKFIYDHINDNLNWFALSQQDNQDVWGDEKLIFSLAKQSIISAEIDWMKVSSHGYFPITESVLESVPLNKLNWKILSSRKAVVQYPANVVSTLIGESYLKINIYIWAILRCSIDIKIAWIGLLFADAKILSYRTMFLKHSQSISIGISHQVLWI